MADRRMPRRGHVKSTVAPGLLLALLSLLTVVWLAPQLPYVDQDSGWVFALDEAVAQRLAFGRDVLFNLGPWGSVYAGQYHPATDGMMLFGGALAALGLAVGLTFLAPGRRRWVMLLGPLLVATVGLHDPVFVLLPLLLLAVAVSLSRPPASSAPSVTTSTPDWLGWTALLLLTATCAMLSFVKSSFGTQAMPLTALTLVALTAGHKARLAGLIVVVYAGALVGFWLMAGQRLADLPAFFAAVPLLISGYTEGLAKSGPWSDIAAYLAGASVLSWLVWQDRARHGALGVGLLLSGLAFTLFVAFKAGFVRHDEHALIACGSLAMLPLALGRALCARSLAIAIIVSLTVLAFVSHHYPGYEWPSPSRGSARLGSAVAGAWSRIADPARLGRQYEADLASIRALHPLPDMPGPSDIYSSGQTILLANGLQWSPRPALQSTTVTSLGVARADLDHLQGAGGRPPVQNVFYQVEGEDGRLPSSEDGLSWPSLLSAFRAANYDRGQDLALLVRIPGARTAAPFGPPLLDGRYRLGDDTPLPAMPGGLSWATLDEQPTLLGRLANFMFRPPVLTLTVRYADGPVERFRLSSDVARAGFLLTPRVRNTEEMLLLLTTERRLPEHRPLSIALNGESGTRWLWQEQFRFQIRQIDIPVQNQVAALLMTVPLPRPERPASERAVEAAAACHIDYVGSTHASAAPLAARGSVRVSGWVIPSIKGSAGPDRIVVGLTDAAGQSWEAAAALRLRPDVAGYFVNPTLVRSGFDVRLDVSSLAGPYTLTISAEADGHRWDCKLRQDLDIAPDRKG